MQNKFKKILPGSKIGIMGSGQLGRMFAIEAIQMGYEVSCYSPDFNSPCSKVGVREVQGDYEDEKKLKSFLGSIDALTFEFENIPSESLEWIHDFSVRNDLIVSPSTKSISIAQNRNIEKQFFKSIGLPVANYLYLDSLETFQKLKTEIKFPCILKTNRFGYDGKGQGKFTTIEDLEIELIRLPFMDHILEEVIPFSKEISIIGARFPSGRKSIFPPSENIHKNHILDLTIHPANISAALIEQSREYTNRLLDGLDYRGVLGLEFFVIGETLICNEFAPRPHNSGHYTQDASAISQFKLQLLTLTNFEFANLATIPNRSIMKNIIGNDWNENKIVYEKLLENQNYSYHDYQKGEIRAGRKMGHWNYVGNLEYQKAFPLS